MKHIELYEVHEIANTYPMAQENEFISIMNSIRAEGQKQSIVLYNGRILDGRNRYKACQRLGIEPKTVIFEGAYEEAVSHSIALNSARRHMNKSQQAMIVAKAVMDSRNGSGKKIPVKHASYLYTISEKYVTRAIAILKFDTTIAENIFIGKLTITEAEYKVIQIKGTDMESQAQITDIKSTVPPYDEDEMYSAEEVTKYNNIKTENENLKVQLDKCMKMGTNTHY